MLDEKYLRNLTKYLGEEPYVCRSNNEIKINVDLVTNYILRKKEKGFSLIVEERGVESYEQFYKTDISEMKCSLALLLKREKNIVS